MDAKKRPTRVSLRAVIDAKCKECIYDPGSGGGGWREQVGACTSPLCPLYPVRTGQKHGTIIAAGG